MLTCSRAPVPACTLASATGGAREEREGGGDTSEDLKPALSSSSGRRAETKRSRIISRLVPDDPVPAEPWDVEGLKRVRNEHRVRLIRARRNTGVFLGASVGLVFVSVLAYRLFEETEPGLAFGSVAVAAFVLFLIACSQERHLHDEELETDDEHERAKLATEIGDPNSPQRAALKLFQTHSVRLRRYYDQTLDQARLIFWVGLLCLTLGFGAIGTALALIGASKDFLPELSDQVVVAALGVVGGVLANFIGVVYIRMHSATIQSLSEFHIRLVATNYLHFGNFLVAKIDDPEAQGRALAGVAEAIAGQAQTTSAPQDAVLKLDWSHQETTQAGGRP